MPEPRICDVKHCGEEAEDLPTPEGEFLCMDHKAEYETANRLYIDEFADTDEFGRNKAAMRRARAT
jgi:hypothetical protein